MSIRLTTDRLLCSHYIVNGFFYDGGKTWKHVYNDVNINGFFYFFNIENTIHYKALESGDFSLYMEYLSCQPYALSTKSVRARTNRFRELYENFDVNKIGNIMVSLLFDDVWRVDDGVHRLAILKHKGLLTNELLAKHAKTKSDLVKESLVGTVGNKMYNDWLTRTPHGYHTYDVNGIYVRGQRGCSARLNEFRKRYNFKGKKVLDFGCNSGGMLLNLQECGSGIGVDYDNKVLGAARKIRGIMEYNENKFTFIQHDFNKDPHEHLLDNPLFNGFVPDVVFMLSVGGWVEDFSLFRKIINKFKPVVFWERKPDEDFFESPVTMIKVMYSYDDITGNDKRDTFMITFDKELV